MGTPQFSAEACRYAPWSLSKAALAKNCSLSFHLQHVKKCKDKTPMRNRAGRIGNAAHEAVELYLKGDSSTETLKQALFRAGINAQLTTPELEELQSFAHNIVRFKERIDAFRAKHAVKQFFVEYRFGLRIDGRPTTFYGESDQKGHRDVFFRGVMDLAMIAQNWLIIIDHKSGNPEDTPAKYEDQLKLYALAGTILFPGISGAQMAVHYIQSEEVVWTERVNAQRIRTEFFPWYYNYINSAAAAASAVRPQPGWFCEFCEYTHLCPKKISTSSSIAK